MAPPKADTNIHFYLISVFVFIFGLTFLGVPLYKMFCQAYGFNGTTQNHKTFSETPERLAKASKRVLKIDFAATIGGSLPWGFKPAQKRIIVSPGETALAFFQAKNLTDKPLIGMAVYHVVPPEVGIYFNKIQCFCFDEQLLNPGEEIDMPVFFFIDPDFADDPRLSDVESITLSYIFFESTSQIPDEYKNLPLGRPSDKIPPKPLIV